MPFSSDELVRALSEVSSWGLDHSHGEPFTILSMPELPQPSQQQPSNESRAVVHLLDDGGAQQAIVGVSEQGWRVCMRSVPVDRPLSPEATAKDDSTFETLDNLLVYLSPEFSKRRQEQLVGKLAQLSREREALEES